jgi:hypothetical protein
MQFEYIGYRSTQILKSFTGAVLALPLLLLLTACSGPDSIGSPPQVTPPPDGGATDTTPPTITVTEPTTETSFTTTSASVTFAGFATDNIGLSQISWANSTGGSGSQAVSGASVSKSFDIALVSGANVITLTARDTAGNTAEQQITVTYSSTPPPPGSDTTPPTINITAPTTGTSYSATSASVTVAGTATDNIGLSQISWVNSKGGSGNQAVSGASVSRSYAIALVTGANVITLTARDTAGNTAQKQLTVNYTPTTSNTAELAWDAVTAPSLVGYRLYYGTTPGQYLQSYGQGINVGKVTTYTLLGLSNGTRHYFAVTAFDSSGKESGYSNEAYKDIP